MSVGFAPIVVEITKSPMGKIEMIACRPQNFGFALESSIKQTTT